MCIARNVASKNNRKGRGDILVEAYMNRGTMKFRKLEQLTGFFRTPNSVKCEYVQSMLNYTHTVVEHVQYHLQHTYMINPLPPPVTSTSIRL